MEQAKKNTFDSLISKAKKLSELLNCDVNFSVSYKTIHKHNLTKAVIAFSFAYFHTITSDILKFKDNISEILETTNWSLTVESKGVISSIHYINTIFELE